MMKNDVEIEFKNLKSLVDNALNKVYKNHKYLIKNKVHERSIVFWFGVYFIQSLQRTQYQKYDLDFEYNKDHSKPKRTFNFPKGTYPDIILHKRGDNNNNVMIIEFKTWWNKNIADDINKLKDFTSLNGKYRYNIGISIMWGKSKASYSLIKNGELINNG